MRTCRLESGNCDACLMMIYEKHKLWWVVCDIVW